MNSTIGITFLAGVICGILLSAFVLAWRMSKALIADVWSEVRQNVKQESKQLKIVCEDCGNVIVEGKEPAIDGLCSDCYEARTEEVK